MCSVEEFLCSVASIRTLLQMETHITSPTILLSNSSQKETVELIIHNNEHSSETKSRLLVTRASKYISVIEALSHPRRCLPQRKSLLDPLPSPLPSPLPNTLVDDQYSLYKSKDTTQKGTPDKKSPHVALIAVKQRAMQNDTISDHTQKNPKHIQSRQAAHSPLSRISQDKAFSEITINQKEKKRNERQQTVSKGRNRPITDQSTHKSQLNSQLKEKHSNDRDERDDRDERKNNGKKNNKNQTNNRINRSNRIDKSDRSDKSDGKPVAGKDGNDGSDGKPVAGSGMYKMERKTKEGKMIWIDLTSNITWQTMHYTRNFESMLKMAKK